MKICHVTGGRSTVPPIEWNSLESSVWNIRNWCERLGHDFYKVNTSDPNEVRADVKDIAPDVVHIHHEPYFPLAEEMAVPVRIVGSQAPQTYEPAQAAASRQLFAGTSRVCCVSAAARDRCRQLGVSEERLLLTRNGACAGVVQFREEALYPERSICLSVINRRKRQHLLQGLDFVDVAGPLRPTAAEQAAPDFGAGEPNYLGPWRHSEANARLTDYGSFVLLSSQEVAPTVTCEALMAGLGLVVSEAASANLDRTQEFIEVIPEARIADREYVAAAIRRNQEVSRRRRRDIRAHARERFDWRLIVQDYLAQLEGLLRPLRPMAVAP